MSHPTESEAARRRWRPVRRVPIDASNILAPPKSDEWWLELALRQQDRFWNKVEKLGGDACWLWKAGVCKDGYGKHAINGPREGRHIQKHMRAHRLAWEMAHGLVPAGLVVCHRCDTPGCVRPAHLFLGTQAENRADCVAKGRTARGERTGTSRLTDEMVREIKILAGFGRLNVTALAHRFGMNRSHVWAIATNKLWRHITPDVRLYRPNLAALFAERKPECCVACDAALPPGRPALCGNEECRSVYDSAAAADYSARKKLAALAPKADPETQQSLFGSTP